jgi:hypothetical protein
MYKPAPQPTILGFPRLHRRFCHGREASCPAPYSTRRILVYYRVVSGELLACIWAGARYDNARYSILCIRGTFKHGRYIAGLVPRFLPTFWFRVHRP